MHTALPAVSVDRKGNGDVADNVALLTGTPFAATVEPSMARVFVAHVAPVPSTREKFALAVPPAMIEQMKIFCPVAP
jgi:hypothetical protein